MYKGKIVKGIAGFYYVDIGQSEIIECKAKGRFRNEGITPLIGDIVKLDLLDQKDKKGNILEIYPRKNRLIRPTVANVDQALIVFAVKEPDPNFSLLDRFIILAEQEQIQVIICFNKIDKIKKEEIDATIRPYIMAGYPVITASALKGEGIKEIKQYLFNKITVFAGPSGVGKSTLLNSIYPQLQLETGAVSEKIKRGKHTTRHAELLSVGEGGYVVDTPGFSSLQIQHIEKEDLASYFIEFEQYTAYCKFRQCVHIHEPECGVKNAVKENKIAEERYKSYTQLYEEINNKRGQWK